MANWKSVILTEKGKTLQAKVEAGKTKLELTKIKLGDGELNDSQTLEGLSELINPIQIIGITTITAQDNGICKLTGIVTNFDLSVGYYLRELGVFAMDPDAGEILYAITTDATPDYLQTKGDAAVVSQEFNISIVSSNTSQVIAKIDAAGLLTVGSATTLIQQIVSDHNKDANAHEAGIAGNAASATCDEDGNNIPKTYVKKSGDTMTGNLNMDDSQERRIIGFTNNMGIYWNPDNIGAFDWSTQKPGGIWSYNKQNQIMTVSAQGGLHVDMSITLQGVSLMKNMAVADATESRIYGYNANVGLSFNGGRNFEIYDWKNANHILKYDGGNIALGAERAGVDTNLVYSDTGHIRIARLSNGLPALYFNNNQDSQGFLDADNGAFNAYTRTALPGSFSGKTFYFRGEDGKGLVEVNAAGAGIIQIWDTVANVKGSILAKNLGLTGTIIASSGGNSLEDLTVQEDANIKGHLDVSSLNVKGAATLSEGASLMKNLVVADSSETRIVGANSNVGISFNANTMFDLYDWKNSNVILHYDETNGNTVVGGGNKSGANLYLKAPTEGKVVVANKDNGAVNLYFANNQDFQGTISIANGGLGIYNRDGTVGIIGAAQYHIEGENGAHEHTLSVDGEYIQFWDAQLSHLSSFHCNLLHAEGDTTVQGGLSVGAASRFWGNVQIDGTAILGTHMSGAAVEELVDRVSGRNTPVMTPLIDWNAMAAANGGTSVKTINNASTGISAYGGDSAALNYGDIILTQSYQNFDAILVYYTDDGGTINCTAKIEKWELDFALASGFRTNITKNPEEHWFILSKVVSGTTDHRVSTTTRFNMRVREDQNCGIIEIYGLNY